MMDALRINKASSILPWLLLVFLHPLCGRSQDLKSFIGSHAIEIALKDSIGINEELLHALSDYSIVMIGEMHGTQEPARFVHYLAKEFLRAGTRVQIGLEIPTDQINGGQKIKTSNDIKVSKFFTQGYPDGRSSASWFSIIETFYSNPNANVFFFDTPSTVANGDRDSIMAPAGKKGDSQK